MLRLSLKSFGSKPAIRKVWRNSIPYNVISQWISSASPSDCRYFHLYFQSRFKVSCLHPNTLYHEKLLTRSWSSKGGKRPGDINDKQNNDMKIVDSKSIKLNEPNSNEDKSKNGRSKFKDLFLKDRGFGLLFEKLQSGAKTKKCGDIDLTPEKCLKCEDQRTYPGENGKIVENSGAEECKKLIEEARSLDVIVKNSETEFQSHSKKVSDLSLQNFKKASTEKVLQDYGTPRLNEEKRAISNKTEENIKREASKEGSKKQFNSKTPEKPKKYNHAADEYNLKSMVALDKAIKKAQSNLYFDHHEKQKVGRNLEDREDPKSRQFSPRNSQYISKNITQAEKRPMKTLTEIEKKRANVSKSLDEISKSAKALQDRKLVLNKYLDPKDYKKIKITEDKDMKRSIVVPKDERDTKDSNKLETKKMSANDSPKMTPGSLKDGSKKLVSPKVAPPKASSNSNSKTSSPMKTSTSMAVKVQVQGQSQTQTTAVKSSGTLPLKYSLVDSRIYRSAHRTLNTENTPNKHQGIPPLKVVCTNTKIIGIPKKINSDAKNDEVILIKSKSEERLTKTTKPPSATNLTRPIGDSETRKMIQELEEKIRDLEINRVNPLEDIFVQFQELCTLPESNQRFIFKSDLKKLKARENFLKLKKQVESGSSFLDSDPFQLSKTESKPERDAVWGQLDFIKQVEPPPEPQESQTEKPSCTGESKPKAQKAMSGLEKKSMERVPPRRNIGSKMPRYFENRTVLDTPAIKQMKTRFVKMERYWLLAENRRKQMSMTNGLDPNLRLKEKIRHQIEDSKLFRCSGEQSKGNCGDRSRTTEKNKHEDTKEDMPFFSNLVDITQQNAIAQKEKEKLQMLNLKASKSKDNSKSEIEKKFSFKMTGKKEKKVVANAKEKSLLDPKSQINETAKQYFDIISSKQGFEVPILKTYPYSEEKPTHVEKKEEVMMRSEPVPPMRPQVTLQQLKQNSQLYSKSVEPQDEVEIQTFTEQIGARNAATPPVGKVQKSYKYQPVSEVQYEETDENYRTQKVENDVKNEMESDQIPKADYHYPSNTIVSTGIPERPTVALPDQQRKNILAETRAKRQAGHTRSTKELQKIVETKSETENNSLEDTISRPTAPVQQTAAKKINPVKKGEETLGYYVVPENFKTKTKFMRSTSVPVIKMPEAREKFIKPKSESNFQNLAKTTEKKQISASTKQNVITKIEKKTQIKAVEKVLPTKSVKKDVELKKSPATILPKPVKEYLATDSEQKSSSVESLKTIQATEGLNIKEQSDERSEKAQTVHRLPQNNKSHHQDKLATSKDIPEGKVEQVLEDKEKEISLSTSQSNVPLEPEITPNLPSQGTSVKINSEQRKAVSSVKESEKVDTYPEENGQIKKEKEKNPRKPKAPVVEFLKNLKEIEEKENNTTPKSNIQEKEKAPTISFLGDLQEKEKREQAEKTRKGNEMELHGNNKKEFGKPSKENEKEKRRLNRSKSVRGSIKELKEIEKEPMLKEGPVKLSQEKQNLKETTELLEESEKKEENVKYLEKMKESGISVVRAGSSQKDDKVKTFPKEEAKKEEKIPSVPMKKDAGQTTIYLNVLQPIPDELGNLAALRNYKKGKYLKRGATDLAAKMEAAAIKLRENFEMSSKKFQKSDNNEYSKTKSSDVVGSKVEIGASEAEASKGKLSTEVKNKNSIMAYKESPNKLQLIVGKKNEVIKGRTNKINSEEARKEVSLLSHSKTDAKFEVGATKGKEVTLKLAQDGKMKSQRITDDQKKVKSKDGVKKVGNQYQSMKNSSKKSVHNPKLPNMLETRPWDYSPPPETEFDKIMKALTAQKLENKNEKEKLNARESKSCPTVPNKSKQHSFLGDASQGEIQQKELKKRSSDSQKNQKVEKSLPPAEESHTKKDISPKQKEKLLLQKEKEKENQNLELLLKSITLPFLPRKDNETPNIRLPPAEEEREMEQPEKTEISLSFLPKRTTAPPNREPHQVFMTKEVLTTKNENDLKNVIVNHFKHMAKPSNSKKKVEDELLRKFKLEAEVLKALPCSKPLPPPPGYEVPCSADYYTGDQGEDETEEEALQVETAAQRRSNAIPEQKSK